MEIHLCVINFHICKFYHYSRGFIFVDSRTLITLYGLIFVVTNYVIFMLIMLMEEKKQLTEITEDMPNQPI